MITLRHFFFPMLALVLLGLAACADEPAGGSATPATAAARPAPTEFVLPTLYPSPTRDSRQPTATPTVAPTARPESTADLQQQLVELRYTVPALGLDRRLEANVAGTVTVVDEAAGIAATLQNQGGVLVDLQSALPELELAPLPEGCTGCVQFSYRLPLSGDEAEGWLQDPVMLASVENYLAITLGPHWPAGAVVGLRRSASPYQVAHTIAYTAAGELYRWRATDPEVAGPEQAEPPALPGPETVVAGEYSVTCPGAPLETLYLRPGAEGESVTATISCPAFALPPALLPLYAALDAQLAPLFAGDEIAPPPSEIPLETMIVYEQPDVGRLLLLMDDTALFEAAGSAEPDSLSLQAGTVLSLTATLEESGALAPGVGGYTAAEASSMLLVRTASGMAEAVWDGEPPAALAPGVERLEAVWEQLAGPPLPEGTPTPEPSPTP